MKANRRRSAESSIGDVPSVDLVDEHQVRLVRVGCGLPADLLEDPVDQFQPEPLSVAGHHTANRSAV